MSDPRARRRRDLTPCILHTDLLSNGGGLARAVPERASLYARHFTDVLILTTGFSPRAEAVAAELRERGTLDPRVRVRTFFHDSGWARALAEPPQHLVGEADGIVSSVQRLPGRSTARLVDRRVGQRTPFRYRYFDADGRLLLTTASSLDHARYDRDPATGPEADQLSWSTLVAAWVDEEIAPFRRPVLFSLQRGLVDPVLLATTKASRTVVSLHNCHYRDPLDVRSGVRTSFRPVLAPGAVDEVVCLTEQQRRELEADAPGALVRAIPYPGRAPREAAPPVDDRLVVMVARLEERKRVDHAIRAFVRVVESVPDARLEVYGAGPEAATLADLVDELGLTGSVRLMGYSHEVGAAQARALCTLLTSTFEGSPRVISESMSRGTPVIAYDIRYGPRDLIRDQVDGVLLTRHQPDALAEAILALLTDPQHARAMGLRAAEVLERFPLAGFEQSWLRVLSPRRRPVRVVLAGWRVRAGALRRRLPVIRQIGLRPSLPG